MSVTDIVYLVAGAAIPTFIFSWLATFGIRAGGAIAEIPVVVRDGPLQGDRRCGIEIDHQRRFTRAGGCGEVGDEAGDAADDLELVGHVTVDILEIATRPRRVAADEECAEQRTVVGALVRGVDRGPPRPVAILVPRAATAEPGDESE